LKRAEDESGDLEKAAAAASTFLIDVVLKVAVDALSFSTLATKLPPILRLCTIKRSSGTNLAMLLSNK
jgi:hypothetical protein